MQQHIVSHTSQYKINTNITITILILSLHPTPHTHTHTHIHTHTELQRFWNIRSTTFQLIIKGAWLASPDTFLKLFGRECGQCVVGQAKVLDLLGLTKWHVFGCGCCLTRRVVRQAKVFNLLDLMCFTLFGVCMYGWTGHGAWPDQLMCSVLFDKVYGECGQTGQDAWLAWPDVFQHGCSLTGHVVSEVGWAKMLDLLGLTCVWIYIVWQGMWSVWLDGPRCSTRLTWYVFDVVWQGMWFVSSDRPECFDLLDLIPVWRCLTGHVVSVVGQAKVLNLLDLIPVWHCLTGCVVSVVGQAKVLNLLDLIPVWHCLTGRVVNVVGQAKALDLLRKTEETEAAGGMMTMVSL